QVTGGVGEGIATGFGWDEEKGLEAGRRFGRGMLALLPAFVGGSVGLTAAAGLTGLDVYGESGSVPAAGIAAGMTFAMPSIARFGGNKAARLVGGTPVENIQTPTGTIPSMVLARTVSEIPKVEAARFAGSQAAQMGATVAQMG